MTIQVAITGHCGVGVRFTQVLGFHHMGDRGIHQCPYGLGYHHTLEMIQVDKALWLYFCVIPSSVKKYFNTS